MQIQMFKKPKSTGKLFLFFVQTFTLVSTNFVFVHLKCAELWSSGMCFLAKASELLALQLTPPNYLPGVVISVLISTILNTFVG